MLKLLEQYKYLVFCNLHGTILTLVKRGVTFWTTCGVHIARGLCG